MPEMTGKDRFFTALEMGTPDRVPLFLRDLTLGLDLMNYTTPEVCGRGYDAWKAARAVISSQARFHQDAVVGCIHSIGLEAHALGGAVSYPQNGIPAIIKHPLDPEMEVDISCLPDITDDIAYQGVLGAYQIISKEVGEKAAIVCNLEGPMTKAALLRGLESFAMDLQQDPSMARELVRYSVSLSEQFIEETSKRGAEVLFIAAATDNPDILGKDAFLEHTIPGVQRLVKKADMLGMGSIFHPHGVFSKGDGMLFDACMATDAQGIQFSEGNDFVHLKESCRGRKCLLGGVDAPTILLLGPDGKIEEETRNFLRACAPGGGFIFMCSCSLHRGMPLANIDAMVNACMKHGRY